MCGIIGILGNEAAAPRLVEALKRLEYRGYDSAGVATLEGGAIGRRRAAGKFANLEAELTRSSLAGVNRHRPHALGHARRADRSQRPPARDGQSRHRPQRHHRELPRAEGRTAAGRPRTFASETDSAKSSPTSSAPASTRGSPRHAAIAAAVERLEGAFGIAVLFSGEDDVLIGARKGSPLAVGLGDGEMYLGSDAIAVSPFTHASDVSGGRRLAVLSHKKAQVLDAKGQRVRARGAHLLRRRGRRGEGQPPPLHAEGNLRAARNHWPHHRALRERVR